MLLADNGMSQSGYNLLVCPEMLEAAKETANPPDAICTAMRKIPANNNPLLSRGPNQQIKVPAIEIISQIPMQRYLVFLNIVALYDALFSGFGLDGLGEN